jgi:hypothetical protein
MAVSGRQCNWFSFAYFLVFGGSLAICIFNKIQGMDGLGTTKPRISDAFATATTVIAAITVAAVGVELIMRSSMSAFLVYPCEFQKRTFCCFDYTMPTFWLMCVILSAVNFIVSAALAVLLIIMVGLGTSEEETEGIKIVRVAVVVGICVIELIVSAISLKMSRNCLAKEKAEEEVDMFEEEETVPLDPLEEELEMANIPKSPMIRSPMMGESPIPRSPMPVGTPTHHVAISHLQPAMSPRWNSSLGLAKSPASAYAVSAIKNSGSVGRYSPTVVQSRR